MAVITISRELGSGGLDIAQHVAKTLGYEFVDKHTADGVFRQYGLTKFDDLYSSAPSFLDLINTEICCSSRWRTRFWRPWPSAATS